MKQGLSARSWWLVLCLLMASVRLIKACFTSLHSFLYLLMTQWRWGSRLCILLSLLLLGLLVPSSEAQTAVPTSCPIIVWSLTWNTSSVSQNNTLHNITGLDAGTVYHMRVSGQVDYATSNACCAGDAFFLWNGSAYVQTSVGVIFPTAGQFQNRGSITYQSSGTYHVGMSYGLTAAAITVGDSPGTTGGTDGGTGNNSGSIQIDICQDSNLPTNTPTPSPTLTPTLTPTITLTPSATNTNEPTATFTHTYTPTYTPTYTATATATNTDEPTATFTYTPTPTALSPLDCPELPVNPDDASLQYILQCGHCLQVRPTNTPVFNVPTSEPTNTPNPLTPSPTFTPTATATNTPVLLPTYTATAYILPDSCPNPIWELEYDTNSAFNNNILHTITNLSPDYHYHLQVSGWVDWAIDHDCCLGDAFYLFEDGTSSYIQLGVGVTFPVPGEFYPDLNDIEFNEDETGVYNVGIELGATEVNIITGDNPSHTGGSVSGIGNNEGVINLAICQDNGVIPPTPTDVPLFVPEQINCYEPDNYSPSELVDIDLSLKPLKRSCGFIVPPEIVDGITDLADLTGFELPDLAPVQLCVSWYGIPNITLFAIELRGAVLAAPLLAWLLRKIWTF